MSLPLQFHPAVRRLEHFHSHPTLRCPFRHKTKTAHTKEPKSANTHDRYPTFSNGNWHGSYFCTDPKSIEPAFYFISRPKIGAICFSCASTLSRPA